ncbi:vacuolar protein sorting-associated protein 55 homolog isoform X1 [Lycium ferocissimum]|uniref:vacuolar protein sorting-associated protein 55 homolog isoform X1 n=2 Tax=Lycium ferocissimum TaxID=112874 RepID=UPI0028164819|nr:vacuolar protein sorting-associated protein 55 homolog isoform X1 [Lycium ferocissimum]
MNREGHYFIYLMLLFENISNSMQLVTFKLSNLIHTITNLISSCPLSHLNGSIAGFHFPDIVLAGLAFMFSSSILLQILACAIYNNWWPMLSALMYVLVPMPCLFFGGGSTQFLISRDGGGWMDAAKFLTGASAVGSIAIPIILRHADLIQTGAMFIEFVSFFIFVCTVMCFHRASLDDEW